MNRRAFLSAVTGGLLAAPLAAEGQQAGKVARIGYVANFPPAAAPHLHEAFLQGLRDLGYVEGRNLVIEYRFPEGKVERFPALAAELVALKVDVIMAPPTPAALAAQQATKTLPIVFIGAGDPVTDGLVISLARPGGNVTGLASVVQRRPGASRQASGTAQAGRSGGQPDRSPLAARWLRRTHGQGPAKGSRTWASGDYNRIAHGIQAVADHVVRSGRIRAGERVLDIACGTGNTALMARMRGAAVTGLDLTPELLVSAQKRAVHEGYGDITWKEGDAEDLRFPDGAFDVVVSSCGLMFAPDQQKVAKEVARVTKRGGRIAIQAWTGEGGVGRMFKITNRYVPPAPGVPSPFEWATSGQ